MRLLALTLIVLLTACSSIRAQVERVTETYHSFKMGTLQKGTNLIGNLRRCDVEFIYDGATVVINDYGNGFNIHSEIIQEEYTTHDSKLISCQHIKAVDMEDEVQVFFAINTTYSTTARDKVKETWVYVYAHTKPYNTYAFYIEGQ